MDRRNFVRITGTGAVIIGSGGVFTSRKALGKPGFEEELKAWAFAAFNRFVEVWNFNDFWKRGNTFDACLNFVDAVYLQWPNDPKVKSMDQKVKEMLEENLVFFYRFDPGSLWADDFGWWGLMGLNARKHLLRIGEKELAEKYLKLSTELCWEYKKNTAYDKDNDAIPVPHGCRNGDANGQSKGVKNTVTNVLLFLLSSRIYRLSLTGVLPDRDKYLDMAFRQWNWFNEWFDLPEYNYFKELSSGGMLVQERPMAFIRGSDYIDKIHPPWAEGWVWTGDQGMLVAALTDMLAVSQELENWLVSNYPNIQFDREVFEEKNRNMLFQLGQGINKALIGEKDGILREAPCFSSFGPNHGNDYLAGRGILTRYIGSPDQQKLLGINLAKSIHLSAEAIWRTRDITNSQFKPEFTTPENDQLYITQFEELWGLADDIRVWDIKRMKEQNKHGVCQSIGLDIIGAAIKNI